MTCIRYDNIFCAVTDSQEEASELHNRAQLMIAIRNIVNDNAWSQAEAAKKLGFNQRRICDLLDGKMHTFSIDVLVASLHQLEAHYK
ncbi:helix-turn-helix domain-containing protein [Marinimicrobium sp. ABcell2]|uniref:helix-turn-helix domain-containing protein n=1 Tax=Marinimicrobium sp. ABcell2 TaxID=3069751 RepID=UPI0027B4B6F4|nr:XRE family transcriptional regulator [Marinimicrobium sp. ABcell2]MDQ2077487.1 XRE family transcriptional regulator [Marinimicrobium sp. ABcell2]